MLVVRFNEGGTRLQARPSHPRTRLSATRTGENPMAYPEGRIINSSSRVASLLFLAVAILAAPDGAAFVPATSGILVAKRYAATGRRSVCRGPPRMSSGGGDLDGKVAVVTGSSRGIGKGIAVTLGQRGCTVYVTGRSVGGAPTEPASCVTVVSLAALVAGW